MVPWYADVSSAPACGPSLSTFSDRLETRGLACPEPTGMSAVRCIRTAGLQPAFRRGPPARAPPRPSFAARLRTRGPRTMRRPTGVTLVRGRLLSRNVPSAPCRRPAARAPCIVPIGRCVSSLAVRDAVDHHQTVGVDEGRHVRIGRGRMCNLHMQRQSAPGTCSQIA
jgi:hypothetical protein